MLAGFFTAVAVGAAGMGFLFSLASPGAGGAMGIGWGLVAIVSALLSIAWRPYPKPPADHPRAESRSEKPS